MNPPARPWEPIKPLEDDVEHKLNGELTAVDALRAAWGEFVGTLATADVASLRRRTMRKHAIETGILERLYQIDWGLTESLVAEGFTLEAAAGAGGEISESTPATVRSQLAGLDLVVDFARGDRPLTTAGCCVPGL